MAKQFLQSWLPSPERIANLRIIRFLGRHAINPLIWYINRRSVAKAVFIGTFFGLLPIPFHSVFIVIAVIFFEVNLPIGLILAWLSNPVTIIPILYIGFWFGTKVFGVHMINQEMILGVLHQIEHWIIHAGNGHIDFSLAKILITGLIIEAFIVASIFYLLTHLLWRWTVLRKWRNRHQKLNPITK